MKDDFCCCSPIIKVATIIICCLLLFKTNAQVVINEVNVKPGTNATSAQFQSLKDCSNPTYGSEYIELYNTNTCTPIDISCYILATPYSGISANSQGSFRFPSGTVIPPLGFLSVGGAGSGATLLLPNFCTGPNSSNLVTGGSRWYLDNFEQYVALYDASGNAIDVVYWTSAANQSSRWNNSSYDGLYLAPASLPNPAACSNITSLAGPSAFPPAIVHYAGAVPSLGTVLERTQDGGTTWATNATATLNSCNGTCIVANPFSISAAVTQPTCASNNGSITITPTPAGTYSYAWSPNVSAIATAGNLAAGSYDITISSGGCQKDTTIVLTSPNGPTAVAINTANASCGQANGSVTIGTVSGGTGPYQYNFNNQGFSSTTNYTSLSAASYSLVVKDASGCTYAAPNIIISNTGGPTAVAVIPTDASCGQTNGTVVLGGVTGGSAPYQYNFNNLGFSSTQNYNSLAGGSYTLIVKDASGCTYTAPNIIINNGTAPTAVSITPTNPTCGQTDGTVLIGNVTGGTSPYQYNFNAQGFLPGLNYTNLGAGTYTLEVKDALGCTYIAPNIVLASANGPSAITTTIVDATCGLPNGSITIGNITGGTAPYQYNFNGQGFSTNINYANISGGSYTLIVEDANNCSYSTNVAIQTSVSPTGVVITTTPAICTSNTGSITLGNITGGTAPYLINFNNQGASLATNFNNLAPADYGIVITDNNGCNYNTQATVSIDNSSGPNSIIYEATLADCGAVNGGLQILSVVGGTAPYSYNFNNTGFGNTTTYTNLGAGSFPIIIKDNNGCILNDELTLDSNREGEVVFAPNSFTPDGDDINDQWYIKGNCVKAFTCSIFNRWGEKIALLDNINAMWNGTYANQKAQQDVYVYIAEIVFESGITKKVVGHINLFE